MKLRTLLACSILLPACAFGADKDPIAPLPEGQRPGPLVEIQPREGTQPKIMAYLTGMDEGNVDVIMLDGKEKRTLPASSIGSMKFNPAVPAKPADTSLKLTELVPHTPDTQKKKDPEDVRPGVPQPGDLRDRFKFFELLHKPDRDLTDAERQDYQKERERFNLPDKTSLLSSRGDARHALRQKDLPVFIEEQRKVLKGTPPPTQDESRKRLSALVYAYELQKIPGREIIEKLDEDLPPPAQPEFKMKRKNMLMALVWDILNHGPE